MYHHLLLTRHYNHSETFSYGFHNNRMAT